VTSPDTAILVALVGLISAILGGLLQAYFTRASEQSKFHRQAKWELYSQYFLTLGELTFAGQGTERMQNALSLMAQLRGRIGVVGSPAVIKAVGDVFRYSNLNSPEAQRAMAEALEAMRRDVGTGRAKISHESFVQLMFGSRQLEQDDDALL